MAGDTSRRQKLIAIVGTAVLVILLAVQGPRTVKLLRGSSAPAIAESVPAPATASQTSVSSTTGGRRSGGDLGRFALKDPFAAGPGEEAASPVSLAVASTAGPSAFSGSGRSYDESRSLAASPGPSALSGAPAGSVPAEPEPGKAGTPEGGGSTSPYTVILSSVRLSAGRGAAEREARRFRKAGLPGVGILVSAGYRSLRSGYYVVHSGSYATAAAAQQAAAKARSVARGARARRLLRSGAGL